MTTSSGANKVGPTAFQSYWDRVAKSYAAVDPLGAVCYPAAPQWFNQFYARLQLRAVERMMSDFALDGVRCLDVGCGGGRWSRWMAARGGDVIGIDPTEAMLDAARATSPEADFQQMSATQLDFSANSFDLVFAVTVLQHLEPAEQEVAAAEMCRVLRPGGTLFVLELIDRSDPGRQVFPRAPQVWIELFRRYRAELVRWDGEEFVPLIRTLMALIPRDAALPSEDITTPSFIERLGAGGLKFLPLWPIVQISAPLEYACESLAPRERARHGAFLFHKSREAS